MSTARANPRGQHSMSLRDVIPAQAWRTLQFAPMWMFTLVAGADGKVDRNEFEAFLKEIGQAPLFKEPLMREVLFSIGVDLDSTMKAYSEDLRDVVQGLGNVADVLDEYATTEQADNFKRALVGIGKTIAESSGGGFMGLADKIADIEKKALVVACFALRVVPNR